jgi:hypothetical protein
VPMVAAWRSSSSCSRRVTHDKTGFGNTVGLAPEEPRLMSTWDLLKSLFRRGWPKHSAPVVPLHLKCLATSQCWQGVSKTLILLCTGMHACMRPRLLAADRPAQTRVCHSRGSMSQVLVAPPANKREGPDNHLDLSRTNLPSTKSIPIPVTWGGLVVVPHGQPQPRPDSCVRHAFLRLVQVWKVMDGLPFPSIPA